MCVQGMIEEAATQKGVVTAAGAKIVAEGGRPVNFEVGTVGSELLGRARLHDGLFIGVRLIMAPVKVPLKAYGCAAAFGNVNALGCRGA